MSSFKPILSKTKPKLVTSNLTLELLDFSCLPSIIKNHYVYAHYKKTNNEIFYIGAGINNRFMSFKNRSQEWIDTVVEHGAIIRIIADDLSIEEVFNLEREKIKEFGRSIEGGSLVNKTIGGRGSTGLIWNDESRNIKREQMSGENNHQFGIRKFGEENPNYNNKGDSNPLSIAVIQLTFDGKFIKRFANAYEAENEGWDAAAVRQCCNGNRRQYRGFLFVNEHDYNVNNPPVYKPGVTSKRPVIGINNIYQNYKTYDCINDTKIDGFNPKNVQQCCKGNKKSHAGIIWHYIDEIDFEQLRYSLTTNEN